MSGMRYKPVSKAEIERKIRLALAKTTFVPPLTEPQEFVVYVMPSVFSNWSEYVAAEQVADSVIDTELECFVDTELDS